MTSRFESLKYNHDRPYHSQTDQTKVLEQNGMAQWLHTARWLEMFNKSTAQRPC
ncbi:hypothetical protein FOPG_16954 [Fusarium oxysporum f. sp. conglutinans race 2 54008]|uniref:Uncharacterized protein n=1 Tax=Fusarium oxysporum f. sp. conglutinans race 2 54008 TaxID=1089457 RepID=X0GU42_FUSOX|nr:hypothetical protein FOPG_16954 [Fusarium oxysporum f. sp. conglutinans race 2 54008]